MQFIKVTAKRTSHRMLIPVNRIASIDEYQDGSVRVVYEYIRYGVNGNKVTDLGVDVIENYDEIAAQLNK